jgi:hypothetical protein
MFRSGPKTIEVVLLDPAQVHSVRFPDHYRNVEVEQIWVSGKPQLFHGARVPASVFFDCYNLPLGVVGTRIEIKLRRVPDRCPLGGCSFRLARAPQGRPHSGGGTWKLVAVRARQATRRECPKALAEVTALRPRGRS